MKANSNAQTCTRIFITALLMITPNWKQTKCPSAGDRIVLGHKKEASTDTCKNIDEPQEDMLSERSQTQKITILWRHLHDVSRKGETESYGWEGRRDSLKTDKRDTSEVMEICSNWIVVMVVQLDKFTKNHGTLCLNTGELTFCTRQLGCNKKFPQKRAPETTNSTQNMGLRPPSPLSTS